MCAETATQLDGDPTSVGDGHWHDLGDVGVLDHRESVLDELGRPEVAISRLGFTVPSPVDGQGP